MISLLNEEHGPSILKSYDINKNILEIDILSRLNHPNILHKDKIENNYIKLPISDRTLTSLINNNNILITEKIYIIYKLSKGLSYFHKHNILLSKINENCIVLNNINYECYEPLFIDFSEAKLINDNDFLLDIYDFGLLALQILIGRNVQTEISEITDDKLVFKKILIASLSKLLENIPYQYYNNFVDFFQNIFLSNVNNIDNICNHILFEKINFSTNEDVNNRCEINGIIEFSEHRNIIKLIIYWTQLILGEYDISLLFLIIDIFNKASINYIKENDESLERMKLAISTIYIVIKLHNLQISKHDIILKISDQLPNVIVSDIDEYSVKIVILLNGILCDTTIYDCCNSINQLITFFNEIILNNDPMVYFNTDIPELYSKNKELEQPNSKNISIEKFFS